MLFQIDLTGASPQEVFQQFWKNRQTEDEIRTFSEKLVLGVFDKRRQMDRLIAASTEHWRIERMAVVDRNVLRMAVYEMITGGPTPAVVIIDEAIEIAKKYGSEDSGAFINGILDAIRIRIEQGEISG